MMLYTKQPISIFEQIERLSTRGLIIDDHSIAESYLSNISYYRLRAYTYPFQNNGDGANHFFNRNDIHFMDIIDLYCFDRRLRSLIFNAIEKIEIAFRTKIIQEYACATGNSHWFMDKDLYYIGDNKSEKRVSGILDDIHREISRSNEAFIKHYHSKYTEPQLPPSWMTLEVLSIGTLSRLFAALHKRSPEKQKVAKAFGLSDPSILENWIHAISNLRNCCAHHSCVWNKRFIVCVKLPKNPYYPFVDAETRKRIRENKIFPILSCIQYILKIISPGSDFKTNLQNLIVTGGALLEIEKMGFCNEWEQLGVWQE